MHLESWRYAKIRRGDIGRRNGAQQHPKAEQVFLEMKREHPSIALGTVYLPPCREQEKDNLVEEKYHER